MSKTIWKFNLDAQDSQDVAMPVGSWVLSVAVQFGGICIWALVDPEAPMRSRRFRVIGTGHQVDLPQDACFEGTVLLAEDSLVFHVFDLGEVPA